MQRAAHTADAPLAVEFGRRFETIGFDLDEAKVARLRRFEDPTGEVSREQFEGADTRRVEVPTRAATRVFEGRVFLLHWAMPNFYFHVVTTYDILRHNGVEIGKLDYLGPVPTL